MMLEMALYLVIAALIAGTIQLPAEIQQIETNQAIATGQYATQVRTAINKYVAGNQTGIVAGSVPGFANPLAPTVSELIATQYLPTGFGLRTALGQTLITQLTPQNCPGANCEIPGISYASVALNDESGMPRIPLLGIAASTIGSDGLISFPSSPAVLTGSGGSTTPNPAAGAPAAILGIRVGFGSFGFQDIVASGVNGPCITITSSNGQIAVRCNGSVTVTDGTNTSTMNAAGFSTPTGTVTTNNLVTSGDNYLNGTATPGTSCSATGSIRTSTTGTGLVICNGTARVWEPIGTAVVNVTNGMPCTNNGQIATDATNIGYICKNNQYVMINNAVGRFAVNRQIKNVTDGMTFAKDSCPGGTAWALYTPGTFLVNSTGYVNPPIEGNLFTAVDQGANWYAQASGRSSSGWYSGNDTANLGGQLVGTFTTGCQY
ncbi:shufflon system plasmid conjugative transfer pilus tip adhesin PilV [Ralstonia pickettii]|nr:shufflon system plasmid conjugative transfer pilus tip adhesin PilV [Ralstonia pickettii]